MKNFIVYRHVNKFNGKVYIGITCQSPNDRWRNGKGYGKSTHFAHAIQKYGWDNFEHEILFEGLSEMDARKKETELIKECKSNIEEFGYNLTEGGEHNIPNQVVKDKISKANKQNMTEEKRQLLRERALENDYSGKRNPFYGKKHDEQTRKRIKNNHWSKTDPQRFREVFCNKNGKANPSAKSVIRLIDTKVYTTMTECAEDNSIDMETLREHCQHKCKNCDYMYYSEYKNLTSEEKEQLYFVVKDRILNPDKYNFRNKAVIEIISGTVYSSIKECQKKTNRSVQTIIRSCKGLNYKGEPMDIQPFMYLSDYENLTEEEIQAKVNLCEDYKAHATQYNPCAKKIVRLLDGLIIYGVLECTRLKIAADHTVQRHCNNQLKNMALQEYMWLEDYERLSDEEKEKHKRRVTALLNKRAKRERVVRISDGRIYNTTTEAAKDNDCCTRKILDHCKGLVKKQEYVYLSEWK